ncbi:MAG: hypothetical protein ABSG16_09775 [Candidatus Acidiferrum sp.]|jgi:hypothetical protein
MILLAKVGLGFVGTLAVAGVYTFREGVMRVDVDEHRADGSHLHLWLPAAAVPMAMHFVPQHAMDNAARQAREYMPVAHTAAHELGKLPDSVLLEVEDADEHVVIGTHNGAIKIDVSEPDEEVHVLCPLATIEDVTAEIAATRPEL